MHLRDYQTALVTALLAALPASRSIVLQLPTGGGKTRIASRLIQDYCRHGRRVWFVCHRREIVRQTAVTLEGFGILHGIVARGHERAADRLVQICSIGSLRRALANLPPPDLVVWDECHHIAAPSWAAIKAACPDAEHLGLSATPERLDGLGLAEWFDRLICGPSTRDLIERGDLSRYRFFAPTVPDLSDVGVWAGEYERRGLSEVMSRPALVGDIVEHYQRLAPGARAIAFTVSVAASCQLVQRFNEAGIPARHVDGRTPGGERDAAVAALEAGTIRILSNVEVFTEGFDLPAIDAVILARPTKSLALYRQMVGRGLRTANGKTSTTVLDHANLVGEHGLPDVACTWTLEGKATRAGSARGGFLRRCPACSSVHEFAAICTACGHEYGTERTVGQIDGTLIEVGRRAGYETVMEFAERIGVHFKTVMGMYRRGMPRTPDFLIPVDDALAWIEARKWDGCPCPGDPNYERLNAFAERIVRPRTTVEKFPARGLPCEDGWVHIPTALQWYEVEQRRLAKIGAKVEPREVERPAWTHPSIAGFIKRHGVTVRPTELLSLGLPLNSDGSVDDLAADQWVHRVSRPKRPILRDYEPVATFLRRIGRWPCGEARAAMLRRGLPIAENGAVHIATGLAWARDELGWTADSRAPMPAYGTSAAL